MSTISVAIICQDNQDIIRDCLKSAKWADEIVAVDAFSKDNTVEIAREYTDKVYQHKVERHLNEQWNRSIDYASCDWVFSLSTDQRFTPELRDEIKAVIQKENAKAAYYVPLENYFLGKWIQHCGWSPDYNILLFKKTKSVYSDKEGGLLIVDGEIGYLKNRLIHYSHTEIADTIRRINMISTREAEYFLRVEAPLKRRFLLTKALRNFRKTYWKKQGYRDGMHGLAFCLIFSLNKFLIYAKYWEMFQKSSLNISEIVEKQNRDTSAAAERLLKERGVLSEKAMRHQMTIGTVKLFCSRYILRCGFVKGINGLISSMFAAYTHAISWVKYWEISWVRRDSKKG